MSDRVAALRVLQRVISGARGIVSADMNAFSRQELE